MPADRGVGAVLQALPEPTILVGSDGRVFFANRPALAQLGPQADTTQDLTELSPAAEAAAELRSYLRRCSGSRSPLIGAVTLRGADGQIIRFRSQGSLLEPARAGAPARILLRLLGGRDERFSALAQNVRDLNEQIRRQRRAQVLLEEALRERDLLMRELHHRVKNNIQMMIGMLAVARREVVVPDADSALEEASRRLIAMGTVHQLLYTGDSLRGVRGDEFLAKIGGTLMEAAGQSERLSVEAEPVEIPNDAAAPLALILNELLVNALKHGSRTDGTPGWITVRLLTAAGATAELSVEDEGPGFEPAVISSRRASGLNLVRGLTRQLGGSFLAERSPVGGARCIVRF